MMILSKDCLGVFFFSAWGYRKRFETTVLSDKKFLGNGFAFVNSHKKSKNDFEYEKTCQKNKNVNSELHRCKFANLKI
jgi:hypothetical protein